MRALVSCILTGYRLAQGYRIWLKIDLRRRDPDLHDLSTSRPGARLQLRDGARPALQCRRRETWALPGASGRPGSRLLHWLLVSRIRQQGAGFGHENVSKIH
jgi:hypothetical protein